MLYKNCGSIKIENAVMGKGRTGVKGESRESGHMGVHETDG